VIDAPHAEAEERSGPRFDLWLFALVGALGLLTLVLLIVGDGNIGMAIAPLALTLLVLVVVRTPLRVSLLVLGFLCLTLENPSEAPAAGKWKSPLYVVGALLLEHLNNTIPVKALFFSGLDLALVFLTGLFVYRRLNGNRIDVRDWVPAARPLRLAAVIVLSTMAGMWGFGMLRSGFSFSNSLWQIFRIAYLPSVFLLYCAGLRGPKDARALGTALLAAALLRALVAGWVRLQFPSLEQVPHATVHADSMLFANAFLMVLLIFFERPSRRSLLLCMGTLPILTWGMVANNRRLVWVELAVALIVMYFVTPMTRLKRRLAQSIAISLPLIAIYIGVGWNHPTGVFGPVKIARSVIDSRSDTSTLWRDLENYNLYYTLRQNPLVGVGLGHEYIEQIHLPTISESYSLYRYAPHNSILGLLAYGGMVGFAGLWMILPLGMFFAMRNYRHARTPPERTAALTCAGILITYMAHCYGDMGLGTWNSVFTVGAALALTAKQAVACGAWPMMSRMPAPPRTRPVVVVTT
jgi:hypothetical protein